MANNPSYGWIALQVNIGENQQGQGPQIPGDLDFNASTGTKSGKLIPTAHYEPTDWQSFG